MMMLLGAVMQQYEARYGVLNLAAADPDAQMETASEPTAPSPAKPHAVK